MNNPSNPKTKVINLQQKDSRILKRINSYPINVPENTTDESEFINEIVISWNHLISITDDKFKEDLDKYGNWKEFINCLLLNPETNDIAKQF